MPDLKNFGVAFTTWFVKGLLKVSWPNDETLVQGMAVDANVRQFVVGTLQAHFDFAFVKSP